MGSANASVWVTGASGMLGRTLLKELHGKYQVLGISRSATPGGVRCDLSDPAQVKRLFKSGRPSLVINSAAYSDVDGCERDPKTAYDCNAIAVKNISEACGSIGIPWIQVSTDYVFNGRKTSPYTEKNPTGPVNIYGLTKTLGEFYAMRSLSSCAVVRTSWLFGAENPANFVNVMASRLKKEESFAVLDDQIDCPTHVKDLSHALLKIGEHLTGLTAKDPKAVWHDVFHVSNEGATTRYEMTLRMKEWLGSQADVTQADRSQIKNRVAVRPAYAAMSSAHFEKSFGLRMRPWQKSLKEYLEEGVS